MISEMMDASDLTQRSARFPNDEPSLGELQAQVHHLESALIQRQEEIAQLRAELEKQKRATEDLVSANEDGQAMIPRLKAKLADADAWVLQLASDRQDLTARNASLERKLATTNRSYERASANLQDLSDRVKFLTTAMTRLAADKDTIANVAQERTAEVYRLNNLIRYKDDVVAEAEYRAEWLRRTLSILTRDYSSTFKGRLRLLLPAFLSLRKKRRALTRADLFNDENYLAIHRDVTKSKIDPLRHYVNFGIIEGRPRGE
jgi:chromosome segregation ATPase